MHMYLRSTPFSFILSELNLWPTPINSQSNTPTNHYGLRLGHQRNTYQVKICRIRSRVPSHQNDIFIQGTVNEVMIGVGQNLQIHRKIISKQVFGSSKSYFKKRWKKFFLTLIHFKKFLRLYVFLWGRERGWCWVLNKALNRNIGGNEVVCSFLNPPVLIFSPALYSHLMVSNWLLKDVTSQLIQASPQPHLRCNFFYSYLHR